MGFFTKTREKGIKSIAKEKQKKQTTQTNAKNTIVVVDKKAPVIVTDNKVSLEEQDKKRQRSSEAILTQTTTTTTPISAVNSAPIVSSLPWWVSDANFIVEGKKISAHKVVITSKSKVLASLLESGNGTVFITQFSHNIFSQLIKWLYSAGFEIAPQDSEELLSCALTFDVPELAEACSQVIRDQQQLLQEQQLSQEQQMQMQPQQQQVEVPVYNQELNEIPDFTLDGPENNLSSFENRTDFEIPSHNQEYGMSIWSEDPILFKPENDTNDFDAYRLMEIY